MKKKLVSFCVVILCCSLMFSSCIGSFSLTGKVYKWNNNVGDKSVNELVFLVFSIVQVYSIAVFVDAVVLNSVEFWTGAPLANAGEVKKVKGENGEYLVKTLENGYEISRDDQAIGLIYNQERNTWNVVNDDINTELVRINNNGTADIFLPNVETQNITLDLQGIAQARKITMMNETFLTKR
jgi:hypothetical protein